jgi:hypothetical protein
VGVLKKIGLLDAGGSPTTLYTEFMDKGSGAAALGRKLREIYQPLFNASHDPARESGTDLRNLFNVHSGGGEDAMRLQIQTFKALAEHASFDANSGQAGKTSVEKGGASSSENGGLTLPPVKVDLHIHLPENKSTREYEAIIQDIARYIYGRKTDES